MALSYSRSNYSGERWVQNHIGWETEGKEDRRKENIYSGGHLDIVRVCSVYFCDLNHHSDNGLNGPYSLIQLMPFFCQHAHAQTHLPSPQVREYRIE